MNPIHSSERRDALRARREQNPQPSGRAPAGNSCVPAARVRVLALLAFVFVFAIGAGGAFAATAPAAAQPAVKASAAAPARPHAARRKPARAASRSGSADAGAAATDSTGDAGKETTSLKGGQEGTVFKSLTVEGEDRVHVEFERPELVLDLDPEKAPGLTWGSASDVLDRTRPDLAAPLLELSARTPSPYLARPWLSDFGTGAVARFSPNVDGVERWRLVVANSRGETVTTFTGSGNPPKTIEWNGRASDGQPVTPGLTYSYVFEAYDRAGNKRNFIGQGFTVPSFRLEGPNGPTLIFSGRELADGTSGDPGAVGGTRATGVTPVALVEAASWLNQSERVTQPLKITATARSYEEANRLAESVSRSLAPMVLGDPLRIRTAAVAEPDAPEGGTVMIGAAK
jgi:hypothetical protein